MSEVFSAAADEDRVCRWYGLPVVVKGDVLRWQFTRQSGKPWVTGDFVGEGLHRIAVEVLDECDIFDPNDPTGIRLPIDSMIRTKDGVYRCVGGSFPDDGFPSKPYHGRIVSWEHKEATTFRDSAKPWYVMGHFLDHPEIDEGRYTNTSLVVHSETRLDGTVEIETLNSRYTLLPPGAELYTDPDRADVRLWKPHGSPLPDQFLHTAFPPLKRAGMARGGRIEKDPYRGRGKVFDHHGNDIGVLDFGKEDALPPWGGIVNPEIRKTMAPTVIFDDITMKADPAWWEEGRPLPDPHVHVFHTLREANLARHAEWPGAKAVDPSFRGVELGGECGEAMAELENISRERGSVKALSEELGDVMICVDLVAMDYNIDPLMFASYGEAADSQDKRRQYDYINNGGVSLAARVGVALNVIKKLERGRLGLGGSKETVENLAAALQEVRLYAFFLANDYGIDLKRTTAHKFNATSEKMGLKTRLFV